MTDPPPAAPGTRIEAVLDSALATFARRGYRRTSMDDVAADARISRPGLYLHVPSKQALLRRAVEHALSRDVAQAERVLAGTGTPLRERLLAALDLWAGQYIGPLAADLDGLLEQDADLLGDLPERYRARFRAALTEALVEHARAEGGEAFTGLGAGRVTEVVLALADGTKRRSADRADFARRLRDGLDLLLG